MDPNSLDVVVVILRCQLTPAKGSPDSWYNFISECVCGVFLKRLAFESGDMNKEDGPSL